MIPVQKTAEQLCQWPSVNRDCIQRVVSQKWVKCSFLVNYPFNKLTTLLWRYKFPFSLPSHVLNWVSVNRKWECPRGFIEVGPWNVAHFSDFCVWLDNLLASAQLFLYENAVGGAKKMQPHAAPTTSWMWSAWSDLDLRWNPSWP